MSTTTTSSADSGAAAAESTAAPAQTTIAPATTEAPAKAAGPKVSRAQAAFDRAAENRQAAKNSSKPSEGQAAGGDGPAGVSTPTTTDPATEDANKAGGQGAQSTSADSTLEAPADWSDKHKEVFKSLPNDAARQSVLDMYKDMQRGYVDATTTLARDRKGREELDRVVQTHGVDAAEVNRVLSLSASFAQDPKQVLKQLASQAGVEVYFEKPLAEGEIPDFKDAKEMAEYIRQQTLDAVRKEQALAQENATKEQKLREARTALETEVKDAKKKYAADWDTHQAAVFERLARTPDLSVEDAYALATLPAVRQLAGEAGAAKQELAALKAKMEAERKNATKPINGVGGHAQAAEERNLRPVERAAKRAAAAIAARKH